MPFPMIHLHIANKIATLHPELIKSLPQFYLGTLAPDSVHFREEFIANDKKVTHLCVSDENWGEVTNNDEWIESVLAFLNEHKGSENACFALGYAVHILSDVYNNIYVWTPYRLRAEVEMNISKYYGSDYHKDAAIVDFRLADEFTQREEVWDSLGKSKAITIRDIVFAKDIEKIRDNILYVQYNNQSIDIVETQTFTYENALNQIQNTTKFISEFLKTDRRQA